MAKHWDVTGVEGNRRRKLTFSGKLPDEAAVREFVGKHHAGWSDVTVAEVGDDEFRRRMAGPRPVSPAPREPNSGKIGRAARIEARQRVLEMMAEARRPKPPPRP